MSSSEGSAMPTRRHVIGATAVAACGAALAGCASGDPGPAIVPPGVKGKVVAQTSDVPVGGGLVISKWKILITQPSSGVFKAFSASCPHRGCAVGGVADGVVNCPCHGSQFAADSGKLLRGPAEAPLAEFPLKVEGGGIVLV
ncbi:Rieske (2Fe-2S) protein [Streptosporangium sp. NPDC048047]|uniref:Rieske (2Fe-2S) protein n=1 Tax=Streptosporangium sp. NPDC048047 TaxID=3155748 RepID=UPI003427FBEB